MAVSSSIEDSSCFDTFSDDDSDSNANPNCEVWGNFYVTTDDEGETSISTEYDAGPKAIVRIRSSNNKSS